MGGAHLTWLSSEFDYTRVSYYKLLIHNLPHGDKVDITTN